MKIMKVKRFKNSELGETASRRPGYDWKTEYARCGRSKCRVCNGFIAAGELRLALMLQDEEGYKSTAWTHFDCFWKHKETKKLYSLSELYGFAKLRQVDKNRIESEFESYRSRIKKTTTTNKVKPKRTTAKKLATAKISKKVAKVSKTRATPTRNAKNKRAVN